jgi:hypothetical protein
MTDYRTAAHEAIARTGKGFGYIPDVHRKQKDSRLRFGVSPTLPSQVSLVSFEAPVMDQTSTSSCVGHGTAQAVYTSAAAAGTPLPFVPSPRFLYAVVRTLERPDSSVALTDSGAMPSDILTVLRQFGVAPIAAPPGGPYSDVSDANVNDEVSLLDLETAGLKLLTGEYRIDETAPDAAAQIRASLAGVGGQKPAACGIGIFVDTTNFMQWNPASGPISTIDLTDPNGGGHWLGLSYSYMTSSGVVVFGGPNSWNTSWPRGGPVPGSPFWKPGHFEITAPCLKSVMSDCLSFPIAVLP